MEEETVLKVSIKNFLSNLEYSFMEKNNTINKKVVFYTMEPTGGSFANHDNEFDDVIWATKEKCIELLKYENERQLVNKTYQMVKKNG